MIKGEYISAKEKDSILNDIKATPEAKAIATNAKVISDDAFAIADLVNDLVSEIKSIKGII